MMNWMLENYDAKQVKDIASDQRVVDALEALRKALKIKSLPFEKFYMFMDNYYCLKYMQVPYLSIFDDPKYKDTFGTSWLI